MDILITGAGKGIGYELTKFFAKNGNHTLFAVSRNESNINNLQSECRNINPKSAVVPITFDLTLLASNDDLLLKKIHDRIDHIDILINNAGYLLNKPFKEIKKQDALEMFAVNFFAPSFLIKELLPLMGGKKNTHVINIGSMGGVQGSSKYAGLAYYSAGKAALAVLTECLSKEYENSGIYFNCLALGAVNTEMLDEAFPGYKAPLNASEMAEFIGDFAMNGHKYFNGKIIPVSVSNP